MIDTNSMRVPVNTAASPTPCMPTSRPYAGPYAELFARQRRPGWDVWGNDTDRFTDGE